jgi:hypothetical protein
VIVGARALRRGTVRRGRRVRVSSAVPPGSRTPTGFAGVSRSSSRIRARRASAGACACAGDVERRWLCRRDRGRQLVHGGARAAPRARRSCSWAARGDRRQRTPRRRAWRGSSRTRLAHSWARAWRPRAT